LTQHMHKPLPKDLLWVMTMGDKDKSGQVRAAAVSESPARRNST